MNENACFVQSGSAALVGHRAEFAALGVADPILHSTAPGLRLKPDDAAATGDANGNTAGCRATRGDR